MIFTRLIDAGDHPARARWRPGSTPSTRKRTRSRCRRARSGCRRRPVDGLGHDLVDELDDRRVVGGLAQVDDLGGSCLLGSSSTPVTDLVEARPARWTSASDVVAGGDDRAGPRSPS